MSKNDPKNLKDATKEEQLDFLNAFDTVFCDIDGVLWVFGQEIDGAADCIKSLREMGKKMFFITNNSVLPIQVLIEKLYRFEAKICEIFRPGVSIISYLKKINFDKDIYVVGSQTLISEIKDAGFKVDEDRAHPVEENGTSIVEALKISPNVGAVVMDTDVNINFVKVQKCIEYVRQNDAVLLAGSWDLLVPFNKTNVLGLRYFIKPIEEITGKNAIILAKPSIHFGEVIEAKIGPLNTNKILVIGDMVETDMAFATNSGYHKLLVLTGGTSKKQISPWNFKNEDKPKYYVESLQDLDCIIKNIR